MAAGNAAAVLRARPGGNAAKHGQAAARSLLGLGEPYDYTYLRRLARA